MRHRVIRLMLTISSLLLLGFAPGYTLPKGIIKGQMEASQELREKNVYGKDIYQGIFQFTGKKPARGYVILMVTVYARTNNILLQMFCYQDYTKITLLKGAYIPFYVYTPHVENYHHHKIDLYLVDESQVKNYETVTATQAFFAKDVAERRNTKLTASGKALEFLNKYRRDLNPPLIPPLKEKVSLKVTDQSQKPPVKDINWNSPITYGFKWYGFGKDENFLGN